MSGRLKGQGVIKKLARPGRARKRGNITTLAVRSYRRSLITEAEQDRRDIARADHVLATTDPAQWRSLDELRQHLGR